MTDRFALPDVPKLTGFEHVDYFTDAVSLALCYGDEEFAKRSPCSVFDLLSGFSGRGWLIGFDDAAWYWERYGVNNPNADFAVSSLPAYLRHADTLSEVFRYAERQPEILWNEDCTYPVEAAECGTGQCGTGVPPVQVAGPAIRRYVAEHLAARQRPVVALLHLPGVDIVEMTLLAGWEDGGDVILGRAHGQGPGTDNSGDYGYFRLPDWEREVLAVFGIGDEAKTEWKQHPCFIAIGNGLKCARSYSDGTEHYGLAAYEAWERALLDDASAEGDVHAVGRRLLYHSMVAGSIACQKCFARLPECDDAPGMGVISAMVRRATSGPLLIHGLMWDAWQVVGGYWRGAKEGEGEHRVIWDNAEEVARFRDRSVRERVAAVVRRARETDAQSLRDLEAARDDWLNCRGRGSHHPCPCWGSLGCARV